jgi:hypothetical protein
MVMMLLSAGLTRVCAGARAATADGLKSARNDRQGQKQGDGVIPLPDKDLCMSPFFGQNLKRRKPNQDNWLRMSPFLRDQVDVTRRRGALWRDTKMP